MAGVKRGGELCVGEEGMVAGFIKIWRSYRESYSNIYKGKVKGK